MCHWEAIAERNQISPQYLEQVFASLRRARIVRSVKGSQGGYLLNYPADKITVSQIVEALEGSYHLESETGNGEGTASIVTETIQKILWTASMIAWTRYFRI